MSGSFPIVPLGTAAVPVQRPEVPAAGKLYRQIGVRLWGQGAYERESIDGSQTKYPALSRVVAGDIVVNKIWARNGSVAIVPEALADCYGSSEFPTFAPITAKLDPRWFHWLTKTRRFWQQCDEKSRGTSGQNRIRPERFLEIDIPLPPVSEQRRIVARIEELAAKIEAARGLRQEAIKEADAVNLSVLHQHFVVEASTWTMMPMDEAITINDKQVDPTLPEYSQLPHISGENIESKTCQLLPWRTAEADGVKSANYLFSPGTVLYSKIRPYLRKAVYVDFRGVCSADMYPIRVASQRLDPHFVNWALVAEPFTEYANRLSGRTRMPKLNRKQLFGFAFAYPPLADQRRIVAELDALQAEGGVLRRLQAETAAELDALLPSVLDKAFRGEL